MSPIQTQTLNDLASDKHLYQTLVDNNVNLVSGLATNYLNHYIEILLLLEILPDMPECFEDVLRWKPMSYKTHVMQSGLPNNDIVLRAYAVVDEDRRNRLAMVADEANALLDVLMARAGVSIDRNDVSALKEVAHEAKERLSPLIERMTGIITPSATTTKPFVDRI